MTTLISPRGATPEWLHLPKAAALTDVLAAGAEAMEPHVQADVWRYVAGALDDLAGSARLGTGRGGCIRIGAHQLSVALGRSAPDAGGPFRWTARAARRSLGLPAVRACVLGHATSPADGVEQAMVDACGGHPGGHGPSSVARWLATLPRPARDAVAAEATTWATQLWTSIEWSRITPGASVGGPDEWWDHTVGGWRVGLRGRADIRVDALGPRRARSLLTMLGGWPTATSRAELVLAALVCVLRRPETPGPTRVVGWWPECGKAWIVAVDRRALTAVADTVVRACALAIAS